METIKRLIEAVAPKVIVPMHTEQVEEFTSIPEFAPCKDRVLVLRAGHAFADNTTIRLSKMFEAVCYTAIRTSAISGYFVEG